MPPSKTPLYTTVDELNGQNIGSNVEFIWYGNAPFGQHIKHVVSGELRQLYHIQGQTTLSLAASDNGDLAEFTLHEDDGITVTPA